MSEWLIHHRIYYFKEVEVGELNLVWFGKVIHMRINFSSNCFSFLTTSLFNLFTKSEKRKQT